MTHLLTNTAAYDMNDNNKKLRICLFHGYELSGSGSNEYTRYLARELARQGHEIHVACREPEPTKLSDIDTAIIWTPEGTQNIIFSDKTGPGTITVHSLPHYDVRPVYVTDKPREGIVKTFTSLTDKELTAFQTFTTKILTQVLTAYPVDIVHANHMILQPSIALDVCPKLDIPFIIFPHGSDIEYTIRQDPRFYQLAGSALLASDGLITGSKEMLERIIALYPEQKETIIDKWHLVGVGVDTSLFTSVIEEERTATINQLILTHPHGGKKPEQRTDLFIQLDKGNISAIKDYRVSYNQKYPDDDTTTKLKEIPWQSGKTMLFVGALTVGKGVQSLICSLPAILTKIPDTHLIIVGSGTYREPLEALVHAISTSNEKLLNELVEHGMDFDTTHLTGPWTDIAYYLTKLDNRKTLMNIGKDFKNHVHFLGRFEHSQLKLLLPCADLTVFPSIIPEAYPLVLMESLSSGVLPAASDLTGLGEGLDLLLPHLGYNLVNLLKLPVEDDFRIEKMISQLSLLLSDNPDKKLKDKLRHLAISEYDWDVRAKNMIHAYRQTIMRHRNYHNI